MLLTQQTGELADARGRAPGASQSGGGMPSWLTKKYLQEFLTNIEGRTNELAARVEAGLKAGEDPHPQEKGKEAPPSEGEKRRRKALLHALKEAQPVMHEAQDAFNQAGEALTAKRYRNAYDHEARGTTLLLKARELFLDMRGLIEVIYGDEKYMKALLHQDDQDKGSPFKESLPLLGELQSTNIKRGKRLEGMFDRELEAHQAPEGSPPSTSPESDADSDQATRRRQFQLAKAILTQAMGSFDDFEDTIRRVSKIDPQKGDVQKLQGSVDQGIKHVEALRRLFFSILEHLRETAERQATLADETRDVTTLTDENKRVSGVAPLIPRQQDLSNISREIADSLKKQSEQSPDKIAGQGTGGKLLDSKSQDTAHRFAQASQFVGGARQAMDEAIRKMTDDPKELKTVDEDQGAAVQKLVEAIQLLSPPPEKKKQQQQEQQQQAQQQDQEAARQKQEQQQAQQMDMDHLLQSVRDREAQRLRDKRRKGTSGYVPVEKDW